MGARATAVADIVDGAGTLYSFKDQKVQSHRDGIGISNGIAFNNTLKKMYYTDSYRGSIDQYDFDIEKGIIGESNQII